MQMTIADVSENDVIDPAPFERVVRHVRGESKIPRPEARQVLAGYLAGMESLVAYLDRFTA